LKYEQESAASMEKSLLNIVDLERIYKTSHSEIRALDKVSIEIDSGQFMAIVGSSGSGKSTLLSIMAGLHRPSSGTVEFEGKSLYDMSRRELAAYRATKVGMIFQSFNLISHYSALKNVEIAMLFGEGQSSRERRNKAIETLERVGLGDRLHHRPADLSGGEQQRTAIARAIVKNPRILFADEPTGNLDYDNAVQVMDILAELNRGGVTIAMVTHNLELGRRYATEARRLHYGKFVEIPREIQGQGGDR
jgi:putative ABC transport system ATP-binding protein